MFAFRLAIETHQPIGEIYKMPLTHYLDWLSYFSQIEQDRENAGKENLAEMEPEAIAHAFGADS